MVVTTSNPGEADLIHERFGDSRLRCQVYNDKVVISRSNDARYRWGKTKNNTLSLAMVHSNIKVALFAVADIPPENVSWESSPDGHTLVIEFPPKEMLREPTHRVVKRKSKHTTLAQPTFNEDPSTITLRQAVQAVNFHRKRMGGDVTLYFDKESGDLKALMEI
jgi:hypothetical protein